MSGGSRTAAVLIGAAAWLVMGGALAQTERIEERPAESGARETGEAAAAARMLSSSPGGPVSFEALLGNPDDPDLNIRYARQLIQANDLRGAVAALERVLLLRPGLAGVRLAYAVLLFRLDSLQEAEIAFREVLAGEPEPATRREVERYLDAIALRHRATRVSLSLSGGFDFNSNRNAAPRSRERLLFDIPFRSERARSDFGRIGMANLQVRHDPGLQERHELLGGVGLYFNDQHEIDSQDLLALTLDAGGILRTAWFDISPSFTYTRIGLDGSHFLDAPGGRLVIDRRDGDLDMQGSILVQYFDFEPSAAFPTEDRRDGLRVDLGLTLGYRFAAAHRSAISYVHSVKSARAEFEAYHADEVTLSHTWLLGGGQFLLGSFSFIDTRYEAADTFISARIRHDRFYRLRAIYGAPVGTLARAAGLDLPAAIGDVTVSLLAEATRADSSIPNFANDNLRTQLLLTKRFDW
ncbi:MAG: hypothetical protein KIT20_11990 [Alphaproteobacteria bacterium]|nr:hypothetical protein [Alphaproteobacteria bacterium]